MEIKRSIWCSTSKSIVHGTSRPASQTASQTAFQTASPTDSQTAHPDKEKGSFLKRMVQEFMPGNNQGTIYELELLTKDQALHALGLFLDSTGFFKIETRDGGSIDFELSKRKDELVLDLWLEEGDLDVETIPISSGPDLISYIYEDRSDLEIASKIKSMND